MAAYNYRCDKCNYQFSIRHSMAQRMDDCPKCKEKGALTRMPTAMQIQQAHEKERTASEDGEIVEDHIRDNKEFLNSEKEKLKERLWEPKTK